MKKALKRHLLGSCQQLLQLRDSPRAIAGGVSIGVFLGITPLFGVKTAMAIAAAWLLRCSKLAAVATVTLHDLFLPLWPLLLRWEYMLGYWLLSNPHTLPPKLGLKELEVESLLKWKTLGVLWPTLLGSLLVALPVTFVCYWLCFHLLKLRKAKKQEFASGEQSAGTPLACGESRTESTSA